MLKTEIVIYTLMKPGVRLVSKTKPVSECLLCSTTFTCFSEKYVCAKKCLQCCNVLWSYHDVVMKTKFAQHTGVITYHAGAYFGIIQSKA